MGSRTACENMNHPRRDAPVSHCPECGGVVNAGLRGDTLCDGSKYAVAAARARGPYRSWTRRDRRPRPDGSVHGSPEPCGLPGVAEKASSHVMFVW